MDSSIKLKMVVAYQDMLTGYIFPWKLPAIWDVNSVTASYSSIAVVKLKLRKFKKLYENDHAHLLLAQLYDTQLITVSARTYNELQ